MAALADKRTQTRRAQCYTYIHCYSSTISLTHASIVVLLHGWQHTQWKWYPAW